MLAIHQQDVRIGMLHNTLIQTNKYPHSRKLPE